MASRISSKSAFWTWRSSSSASASSSVGGGEDHAAHDRQAVLAEEHVLGAAQADALGAEAARALAASGPLSALARTASWPLRISSAQPRIVCELGGRLGRRQRDLAEHDLAGGAVERDDVALVHDDVADGELAAPSILMASAPTTAGVPQPRATTAAWLTRGRRGR